MNKLLKGIYDYYQNLLKEKNKRGVKFKGNIQNPYEISDWLLDISESVKYSDDFDFEYHIDNIFKFIGYNDIILSFRRGELDKPIVSEDPFDYEECNWLTYFSYKKMKLGKNIELSFVKTYGVNHEPMEFIPFMFETLVVYESELIFDKYE